MILAMSCISLLGSIVWAHHMFTAGLISDTRAYFMSVTMIISIPTGTKVFNWFSTYIGSNAIFSMITTSVVFFVIIFLIMFTIGGSTGIILGSTVIDIGLHDTYYVVTHFHLVLSLGTVIGILLGCYYLQDYLLGFSSPSTNRIIVDSIIVVNEVTNEMDGIIMDLSLSYGVLNAITSSITRYYLIVNFIGTTFTFIPMHFLGFNVMPRRIPDLSDY